MEEIFSAVITACVMLIGVPGVLIAVAGIYIEMCEVMDWISDEGDEE